MPFGIVLLEQRPERRPETRLNLFHDGSNERFLAPEIMEEHASAGSDRRRERTQRKVSYPVAQEISEALLEEFVAIHECNDCYTSKDLVKQSTGLSEVLARHERVR